MDNTAKDKFLANISNKLTPLRYSNNTVRMPYVLNAIKEELDKLQPIRAAPEVPKSLLPANARSLIEVILVLWGLTVLGIVGSILLGYSLSP